MATDEQIKELANAIALQADAVAKGEIDHHALYATVRLIASNAETLKAWTADREYFAPSPGRKLAVEAVATVEASGVLDHPEIQGELDAIDSKPSNKTCNGTNCQESARGGEGEYASVCEQWPFCGKED